jgi:HD-GYP domain-containing protein (c-di-GMP phosphodiesterase class II)
MNGYCAPPTIQNADNRPDILSCFIEQMAAKDPEMHPHGRRTAQFAVALGSALGLRGDALVDLYYAGVLHDIGKLMLPDALLHKDGPLSADEYTLVQSHPRAATQLLEPFASLRGVAVLIAHHHEHWDGSGYPFGLRGELIPLGARILAVTDTYDALTSGQCHRPVHEKDSAVRLLRILAGTQLEPALVSLWETLAATNAFDCALDATPLRSLQEATGRSVPTARARVGPLRMLGGPPLPL